MRLAQVYPVSAPEPSSGGADATTKVDSSSSDAAITDSAAVEEEAAALNEETAPAPRLGWQLEWGRYRRYGRSDESYGW